MSLKQESNGICYPLKVYFPMFGIANLVNFLLAGMLFE